MTKSILGLFVGFVLLLTFTACDRRNIDVPTDPTRVSSNDAKWVLSFLLNNIDKYTIELHSTSDFTAEMQNYNIELTLGDSLLDFYYANPVSGLEFWSAYGVYDIPEQLPIKLKINGTTVLNSFVTPVNKANAAFPASYNYLQPLTLNWAVTSGNQYQFARAESFFFNDKWSYAAYSSYIRQVSANTRNYTFPANCLTLEGDSLNTVFSIGIQEIDYKIVNKTAILVSQIENYYYPAAAGSKIRVPADYHNALVIHKILSK